MLGTGDVEVNQNPYLHRIRGGNQETEEGGKEDRQSMKRRNWDICYVCVPTLHRNVNTNKRNQEMGGKGEREGKGDENGS